MLISLRCQTRNINLHETFDACVQGMVGNSLRYSNYQFFPASCLQEAFFGVSYLSGAESYGSMLRPSPTHSGTKSPERPGYVGFRMNHGRDVLAVSLTHKTHSRP
jgi:hypothetical protein